MKGFGWGGRGKIKKRWAGKPKKEVALPTEDAKENHGKKKTHRALERGVGEKKRRKGSLRPGSRETRRR